MKMGRWFSQATALIAATAWLFCLNAGAQGTGQFTGSVNGLFTGPGHGGFTSGVTVQNVGSGEATVNVAYYDARVNQNANGDGSGDNVLPWEQPNINTFQHMASVFGSGGCGSYGDFITWLVTSGCCVSPGLGAVVGPMEGNTSFSIFSNPDSVNVGGCTLSGAGTAAEIFDASPVSNFTLPTNGQYITVFGPVVVSPCGTIVSITNPTGVQVGTGMTVSLLPGATAGASKD